MGLYHVQQRMPTDIFGLNYVPKCSEEEERGEGSRAGYGLVPSPLGMHITPFVENVLRTAFKERRQTIHNILEIGVSGRQLRKHRADGEGNVSSTEIWLEERHPTCRYFGVDISDRTFTHAWGANIQTWQGDSKNQTAIRAWLADAGVTTLDWIFIDGYHNIEYMVNDWRYVDLLSRDGAVAFHDTSGHIGPHTVVDAIDPAIFATANYPVDYGVAVCTRR